jgi:hypothetical protein
MLRNVYELTLGGGQKIPANTIGVLVFMNARWQRYKPVDAVNSRVIKMFR